MKNKNELIKELKISIALTNFEQECKHKYCNKKNCGGDNMKKSTIIATILSLIMGCSVVMATSYIAYEKIWKEPESYTYDEYMDNLSKPEITNEEKQELISEEEAKQKGIEIFEKLGYKDQTIEKVELNRGSSDDVTAYYMVKTKWGYEEGLMVQLNAKNGEFISFRDMELPYKHLQSDELSDEEISNIATEIYNRLEIKNSNYKVYETKIQNLTSQYQTSKMLEANLCRFYDNVKNTLENCRILFMVIDDEIFLNSITFDIDSSYQDNPIVITKEEAINIAKDNERELSPYEITNITCELSIQKMNTEIYEIERGEFYKLNEENERKYYETENIVRKVWKVKVEHNVDYVQYLSQYVEEIHQIDDEKMVEVFINKVLNNYAKEGMNKFYYVDATTGEIIGGLASRFD